MSQKSTNGLQSQYDIFVQYYKVMLHQCHGAERLMPIVSVKLQNCSLVESYLGPLPSYKDVLYSGRPICFSVTVHLCLGFS